MTEPQTRGALIVLHGHGGSSSAAAELARAIDPTGARHHLVPDAPWLLDADSRSWFEAPADHATAGRVVAMLVRGLVEDGGMDPRDIAVVGWSQGGAAALAGLAVTGAPKVGALVLCSAFLADGSLEYDFDALDGVPVLIQHGRDDDVVPVWFADDLATLLRSSGVEVTDQRFAVGHERGPDADADVAAWLTDVMTGARR